MGFRLPVVFFLVVNHFVQGNDRPCNGTIVGRVTNNKLNEISGLVESHRFPGTFYSIEDSGNKNIVYVFHKNGTVRGEIVLYGVKNNDFEDIALSSGPNGNYIYVGDIGNDWPNHCQGYNQTNRMVHIFREPYLNQYRNSIQIIMPTNRITTLVLHDAGASCREDMKVDTEAMIIDSISKAGYIIQKVRPRNANKNPVIFKFDIPTWEGENIDVKLKRVGNIPSTCRKTKNTEYPWPTFITAGDISRDGKLIILRGHNGVRLWNRDTTVGESVEHALMHNKGREMSVCHELQGESVAITEDGQGFYTISEAKGEDIASEVDVPMFYYSLSKDAFDGNMCENVFEKKPETKCVLYENERCDGRDGLKELHDGERLSNVENQTLFSVESISLRKGCRLTLYTGSNFMGKYYKYTAAVEDLHVTFEEENHTSLHIFTNNVNSAVCTCISIPIYYPFFHGYYPFPHYPQMNQILYPFITYANFLHGRNWFYP